MQEQFADHILYIYGQFLLEHNSYTNAAIIDIEGSREGNTGSGTLLDPLYFTWNIQLVTAYDVERNISMHTIHIDSEFSNQAYSGNTSFIDIQSHIQVYTDHSAKESAIYIDQRELEQSYPQAQNITLLDQLLSMQTHTWIKRDNTDISYFPGWRLSLISNNMQHARILPDLKKKDGRYISTAGTWASLEANMWPEYQQMALEDKNNVLKLRLEKEGKWDYQLSILTSPDMQWRLDGDRDIDISNKEIKQSSTWIITTASGLDIDYIYTSSTTSDISEIIPPVRYIDGEELMEKLLSSR